MAVSYNGWVASENPGAIGIRPLVVDGVSFPGGVRGGDVHTVFEWLARQFHTRIEPLHAGWCWGYDYRQNRNANNLSCHSSGTAVDFNAPNHPNGSRGTFSNQQVTAIRELLAYLEGVLYWGGDFGGTVDEMHFEVDGNATEADVARVATKIRNNARDKEFTVSPEDETKIANMLRSIQDKLEEHIDAKLDALAADVRSHPYWAAQLLANGKPDTNRRYSDAAQVSVFESNNLAAIAKAVAPTEGGS